MNIESSERLIGQLAKELKKRALFMCAAESCTGGLIAAMCTNLPGSSEWFKGGVVSYSNEMKMHVLGVPENTLQEHGAVSTPVVEAMASGALPACAAHCSIAVSGIAGPDGGSAQKPVGTVCIAALLVQPGEKTALRSATWHFAGDRAAVREQAAMKGLEMLRDLIEQS